MFLLATFSKKCAMLLCTVLFMPSPAMGGVPSAPGDVAGAIGIVGLLSAHMAGVSKWLKVAERPSSERSEEPFVL